MPYFISDQQSDCSGWATVKQESDGSYTTMGCHDTKQGAIDQMVAVSISEDIEPGGEVSTRTGEDRSKMKKSSVAHTQCATSKPAKRTAR